MALGYVRVSKEEENPKNQKIAIREFAERHGLKITGFFQDIGISGSETILEREGFKSLIRFARDNETEAIVIYDITRFGRSMEDVVSTYRWLVKNGFKVFFVKQPFLSQGIYENQPYGEMIEKLMFTILAWAAEMEREMIRIRTIEGLERARREGKRIGRPPAKIDRRKVEDLMRKGVSMKDMSRILGVGYSTIRKYIRKWNLNSRKSKK